MGHLYHGYVSHNQMVWRLNMAKVGLGLAKKPADAGDVGETTIGFSPEIDHFGESSLGKKIWPTYFLVIKHG